jgi:4-hydroxybenzoate polyprenyltransferase
VSTSKTFPDSSAASGLGIGTLFWVNARPLLNRLERGEGLLLAVNLSIVLVARPDVAILLAQVLISTVVLALLYGLNDVYDCARDRNDPGKDQALARFCVAHRRRLLGILQVQKVAVVLAAFALLGARSAGAVAALFLVNLAYSAILKGKAGLDVLWVGLWGALYAMVPGVALPLEAVLLVGVMTSICHVFQILRDRDADDANRIQTSAVASRWLPYAQLGACCSVMAAVLWSTLGPLAAASAFAPLALRLLLESNQTAWLASKAYYGIVWLLVLRSLHG